MCATNWYFQILNNINDVESYNYIDNLLNINKMIFISHWTHLTVINCWCASIAFHIGWQGNYEYWINNPIKNLPIAHSIFDQHVSSFDPESDVAYSGLYNLLITIGFTNTFELYKLTIFLQLSTLLSDCINFIQVILVV